MREDAVLHFSGSRGKLHLLLVLLVPPAVWALHLQGSYLVASEFCHIAWVGHIITLVALGVLVPIAWMARRNIRWLFPEPRAVVHAPGANDATTVGRSRFLAAAGLASTVFFALLIVAGEVPNWFHPGCA